jgi:PhnB protein
MAGTATFFAPQLYIPGGVRDISFYEKAFGAVELQRWSNDDGTLHVAELSIDGSLFHVHEEKTGGGHLSPARAQGITTLIGLFVTDVDALFNKAVAAGGIVVTPPTSYEYGYRQAEVKDPFGHIWMIEKKV